MFPVSKFMKRGEEEKKNYFILFYGSGDIYLISTCEHFFKSQRKLNANWVFPLKKNTKLPSIFENQFFAKTEIPLHYTKNIVWKIHFQKSDVSKNNQGTEEAYSLILKFLHYPLIYERQNLNTSLWRTLKSSPFLLPVFFSY